jgi:steroid delta-isomerase-like uncharacterized protein
MSAENKALVRRFYAEIVNKGDMTLADELMAQDYIEHGNPAGSGLDGFKKFVAMLAAAFPDLQVVIEDMIAEADKVVARVTVSGTHQGLLLGSIAPTGKHVTWTGIDIFQIAHGRIVGRWNQRDLLGLMRQIDA